MTDTLTAGSIAFTGFNADGDDSIAFVSFSDIPAGTVIHFTDNSWNGSSFATDENVWSWTATSDVAAGTIISMTGLGAGGTASSNVGAVQFDTSNPRDIADANEVVYAYTGDASAPVFLTAITNAIFNASLGRGTLDGTGLTQGVDAKQLNFSPDIAAYVGDRSSLASIEDYKANIYATANWQLQGDDGDQSHDGTNPDLPFSTQAFTADPTAQKIEFASATVSIAEGDSGDTVLTLTLNRIGSTSGVTTFSGTVNSVPGLYGYADGGDFNGTLPTFSGSFADGASTATVTFHISGDTTYEPDEHFFPVLDTVASSGGLVYIGNQAAVDVTIVNDDPVQFVGFDDSSLTISQAEGNVGDVKTYTFVVKRTGSIDADLSFSGTIDGSADAADFGGTTPTTFSGVIKAGESTATVTITTAGDVTLEGNDSFTLHLTTMTSSNNTAIIQTATEATGIIVNDEPLHIGAGQTVTSPITIGNGDHLAIDQGGSLAVPDPLDGTTVNAIIWAGGTTAVDNAGSAGLDGVGHNAVNGTGVTGSFTFNNAATGVVEGALTFARLGSGSVVTVNNAGLIDGSGNSALILVDAGKNSSAVINNLAGGVITAGTAGYDLVRAGPNTVINNSGIIRSAADSIADNQAGGDAIDYGGSSGGVVHNFAGGLIEGSHHAITNKKGTTVINDAGATLIGRNGSGVNIDNDATVANTVHVTNRGTIIGMSAAYEDSDGDAIDTDGLVQLDNYGYIAGIGANGYHNGEVNVSEGVAVGGGVINNFAGGTIYGYGRAIQVDDSSNGAALGATTIYNEGLIKGDGHGPEGVDPTDAAAMNAKIVGREAIDILGSFADTITNKGRIVGGVFTDDGDDVFNAYAGSTVSGNIDLGAGNDTVNLYAAANPSIAGVLGTIVNIENLNVKSGSWSISSVTGISNIDIANGGTVTSAMTLSGTQHLTIEHGGTAAGSISWQGTNSSTIVDNDGVMQSGLSSGTVTGSLVINNHADGQILAGLNFNGSKNGTTIQINNDGLMQGNGNFALRVSRTGSATVTVTNSSTGTITSTSAGTDVINWASHTFIDNYGKIVSAADTANDSGGDAIDFNSGLGNSLHNEAGGLIAGSHHAVTGEKGLTVVNEAGGVMIGRNGSAVNMDNDATVANTVYVTNKGDMEGQSANYADSDGDAIDVDGLLQLDNYGTVQGLGANGYHGGTAATDANISEGVAFGGGSIHNYAGATIYGYGRAIQVDDSSNGAALAATTIINDGKIQGGGHGPTGVATADAAFMQARIDGAEAIDIIGSYADTITNTATGQIIGGIFTDGGNDTLTNAGTITAMAGSAVNLGDGNDTLNNSGKITGTVLLGAGDDVFNQYAGSTSGKIDGGDGYDTIRAYAAPGSSTVGVVSASVNVEKLDIVSGSWMLSNGFDGANIEVESGAMITSGSAATAMGLTGGQTLTVDQGGLVQGTKFAIGIALGDTDAIVINSGTIRVTSTPGTKADAITLNGATATIHNTSTGYIEGARHAITGPLGIHVINDAGGVIVGLNGSAVNMDNSAIVAYTAYVDNYGIMLGESANISDSDGDAIDTDGLAVINNYGFVAGTGANGYHKGEANVSEGIAIGGGVINNYAGGSIYGYGRAIEVDDSSNGAAFASTIINNAGLIEGDGHGPTGVAAADVALFAARLKGGEAINIIGNYADTITNSGSIIGGVETDGGDDVMSNSGVLVATGGSAVDLGAGNDTFTNSGTVSGDVLLGAGDDTINLVAGSTIAGTIDGGDGNDTLNLTGSGAGALGKGTGIEKVDVKSGDWAIDSDAGYSNVTVESGASLVVRGAVATGTVEQGAGQFVYGHADHTIVLGEQAIHAGGVATATTIGAGGEQNVVEGAAANGTTIEGGTQHVFGSADDTTVDAAGLQLVHGRATDTVVNSGGEQNIYQAATAIGTTVNSGGIQIDWGTAVATTIDGGSQYVYGTATDTVILSGSQYIAAGGATYGTMIGSGGTAHAFGGGSVHNATFAGSDATLVLDHASDFSGFISGWQDGNHLDLSDIQFGEGTTLAYAANANNSGGKLTVSDGSHTVSLALLGQYTAADFALASDGHGGTMISDPGVQVQNQLATVHA